MGFQRGDIVWGPSEKRNPEELKHAAVVWDG